MSVFLLYFDGGALDELAGMRGGLVLRSIPMEISFDGSNVARRVLSVTDGVASDVIRGNLDAKGDAMRRELALMVVERSLKQLKPRLVFHVFHGSEARVDLTHSVAVDVMDLVVRVSRVRGGARTGAAARRSPFASDGPAVGMGEAEGDVVTFGDLLRGVPCDVLITLGGAPGSVAPVKPVAHGKRSRR